MIKNRVMISALMCAMVYRAPAEDESSGAGAPADPAPVVAAEPQTEVDLGGQLNTNGDPASQTDVDGAGQQDAGVTDVNESNLPPDPEPHPVGGVLDEIESAVSNYAHELTANFRLIIEELVKKAKDLV